MPAMLSTPLTPPLQHSSLDPPQGGGAPLTLKVDHLEALPEHEFATPVSLSDEHEASSELAGGMRTYDVDDYPSDDDQDMSDGGAALPSPFGAPLTMTNSHAEALNAEMDLLDAELMGDDNYHYMAQDSVPIWPNSEDSADDVLDDEPMFDGPPQYVPELPATNMDLPTAMSNLSQQLQHIQEGQEHGEFGFPEIPHGSENSTVPLQFDPVSLPISVPVVPFINSQVSVLQHVGVSTSGATGASGLASHGVSLPSSQASYSHVAAPATVHQQVPHPHGNFHNSSILNSDELFDDDVSEADPNDEVEEQYTLGLSDFLTQWARATSSWEDDSKRRPPGPDPYSILNQRDVAPLLPMEASDLQGEYCDMQRIDWKELGVSRLEARQMRRVTIRNYRNLRNVVSSPCNPRAIGSLLPDDMDYFKFRRMDFDPDIHLSHFQLRNLLACVSRDHVFYAGKRKVMHYKPIGSHDYPCPPTVAMDLTTPTIQSASYGIQISTLTASHNILVAGGFTGEYSVVNLRSSQSESHCEGILTDHNNAITNHVQVHLSRQSSLPLASFASNDGALRIVDVSTNRIIATQKFDMPVNCSAISPDQRLRVIVGDTQKVMICNSETGQILQELDGHRDYGFACDWADDGWTVATGNQDKQVKIWDARKWKNSSGASCPVTTIFMEIGGARKVKFSPVGSGKRILVAAEPADILNIIDAETFNSKQLLSFFGEIGGFDFTNDGQDLLVGNCDTMRGGIMQFERCGLNAGSSYGFEDGIKKKVRIVPGGFDWHLRDEDVSLDPKSRRTPTHRLRNPAQLGLDLPFF